MGAIIGVQMDADTSAAVPDTAPESGRRGRDADFEAWMTARQSALLRTACLLTGDTHTAEDLVQTTLAKMYLAWDRIADREHVDAYARKTLVNEFRSLWRRPWRRRELTTEVLPEQGAPDVEYDGLSRALWEFVATLPPKQRAVIVLRYYEELTEAETAAALGISVGTVKSQASRALASLRRTVDDHPEIGRQGFSGREEDR
jgi:RNA polymerase sigma-70 factor (sigma-E family)